MININIDTAAFIAQIEAVFGDALNPVPMMQQVAVAVLPHIKKRVHEDGLDATGRPIGNYSEGYMQVRTGIYGNIGVISRGANKGKPKNTGVYSRGKKKGMPRPKYNRTSDTKVILSLTRQMENDLVYIPTTTGAGIGYNNPDNYQKALWCEATYDKVILTGLTEQEEEIAQDAVDDYLNDLINQL